MFYYVVDLEGAVFEYKSLKAENDESLKLRKKIINEIARFNKRNPDTYYALLWADSLGAEVAVISKTSEPTPYEIAEFTKQIKLGEFCEMTFNEKTLDDFLDLLSGSLYFDDRINDVLGKFGLSALYHSCPGEGMEYKEHIMSGYFPNEATLIADADKNMSVADLKAEIKRIFSRKAREGVEGHPVHYIIETDDCGIKENVSTILFQALYKNGRIKSRKYCDITVNCGGRLNGELYECLYMNCTGGAVVIDFAEDIESDFNDYVSCGKKIPDAVCDTMKMFRHSVLTVMRLPRSRGGITKEIYDKLSTEGVVLIREDMLNAKKSREYLRNLAKESGVAADKLLYAEITPDSLYLPTELEKSFERWYDEKLRRTVYPQYKFVSMHAETAPNVKNGSDAYDELDRMIGLKEVKETITKALNYYKIQHLYKDYDIPQERAAMHMVFTGNPGTAKTTAARIFAKIMRENGMLSSGHLVEIGRAGLVGKFVGWTAQIVKQKFKEANGGVLFIDEAYSLADGDHGSFGEEAINTIVQEMENNRDDLIVIFAGYPDEMKTFLDTNHGLRSRIAFHIDFPDYSTDELCEIARHISASSGVTLSEGAVEKLAVLFEQARTENDFGNGRFVRNVIEQSKMNLASRVITMDADKITKKILTTIEAEDVIIPEIKRSAMQTVRRIGFSAR